MTPPRVEEPAAPAGSPPGGAAATQPRRPRGRRTAGIGFLALVVGLAGASIATAFVRAGRPAPPAGRRASTPGWTGERHSAGLVRYGEVAADGRARDAARTLDSYFAGINDRDYARVRSVLDPANPNAGAAGFETFVRGVSTTRDSDVVLHSLSAVAGNTIAAGVTFRSTQSPGHGPAGSAEETCTRWSLTFTLVGRARTAT